MYVSYMLYKYKSEKVITLKLEFNNWNNWNLIIKVV